MEETVRWTLLTVGQILLVTVGLLLGAKVQAAYGTARTKRSAIFGASTVEELDGIP